MHKWIPLGLLALLLGGCATQTIRVAHLHDRFVVLNGAIVRLKQPLPIDPGNTRVFIQGGEIKQEGSADQYAPACDFEVENLSSKVQTIEPGDFVISTVQQVSTEIAMLAPAPVVASVGDDVDEGGASYFEGYNFWLTSAAQPQVMRMTCLGAFASPGEVQFPTLDEIRNALGSVAQIIRSPGH